MTQTMRHEQIRRFVGERLPYVEISDAEVEGLAAMPIASHLCASQARDVDAFLRGLPDDLLARLRLLADDFLDWSDIQDPDTWPHELTALATMLYFGEAVETEAASEEIGFAAARLAAQTLIACARRDGLYSFVSAYSLISGRAPLRAPALSSPREH